MKLTTPRPESPLEERLAWFAKFARSLVVQAAKKPKRGLTDEPVTPVVPREKCQVYGEVMFEKARLVIEEWTRAERNPMDSQSVATAIIAMKHTIEAATEVVEVEHQEV